MPAVETRKNGVILFLKAREDIDTRLLKSYDIETGVFHHPVVVLHSVDNTEDVVVGLMTTLGGANVEDRFPPALYGWYLAIYPKPAPSQDYRQLRLVGDVRLRKPGYVSTRQSHRVHKSMLKPYDRSRPSDFYRLTASSLAYVATQLPIVAPRQDYWNSPRAQELTRLISKQRQLRLLDERSAPSVEVKGSYLKAFGNIVGWVLVIALAATWWVAKKYFTGVWWLVKKTYTTLRRTNRHS